jgi:hypothetical protein
LLTLEHRITGFDQGFRNVTGVLQQRYHQSLRQRGPCDRQPAGDLLVVP